VLCSFLFFFFSSRRRHTRCLSDWSSDVCSSDLQADLIWMSEQEMLPGRRYLAKLGARTVGLTVDAPKHRLDVDTGTHLAAKTLRSEERRVGKECRSRRSRCQEKRKDREWEDC